MLRIFSSLVLVIVLNACTNSNNLKPADTTKLVESEFDLSGLKVSLYISPEANISNSLDSDITLIDFQPNTRNQFKISLKAINTDVSNQNKKHTLSLANGAILTYDLINYSEQGSGGPEASLLGNISFDDATTIEVTCHIQQDASQPDARWCIPYLHHLKVLSNN